MKNQEIKLSLLQIGPAGERAGAGAAERDLPDGGGRAGRYHQATAGRRRRGLFPGAGHRREPAGADPL